MNRIEKVRDSKEMKDRAAGYCLWRIFIPQCQGCGKLNASYSLNGTRQDAERFASNPENDRCNKCS